MVSGSPGPASGRRQGGSRVARATAIAPRRPEASPLCATVKERQARQRRTGADHERRPAGGPYRPGHLHGPERLLHAPGLHHHGLRRPDLRLPLPRGPVRHQRTGHARARTPAGRTLPAGLERLALEANWLPRTHFNVACRTAGTATARPTSPRRPGWRSCTSTCDGGPAAGAAVCYTTSRRRRRAWRRGSPDLYSRRRSMSGFGPHTTV